MPAGRGRPFLFDREDIKLKAAEYLESEGYKTITDFCCKYRISRKHFYNIANEDKDLLHISEMIGLERERHLEIGGLSGELNAGMAKFALSQMGWTEKQEVKQETLSINVGKEDSENVT